MAKLDLTKQRFGNLLVIAKDDEKSQNSQKVHWLCKCDCGNLTSVAACNLRNGHTKSCGCISKKQSAVNGRKTLHDLANQKFGKLTALSYNEKLKKWKCKCECGNDCYVPQRELERKKKPQNHVDVWLHRMPLIVSI